MIDLHTHSTASDGTMTPKQILELSDSIDLYAVALTDHDTISGLKEFKLNLPNFNVKGISGVEIAVEHNNKEYHFLAYFIDYKNDCLLNLLFEIRTNRNKRNIKIIKKLNENNFNVTYDELLSVSCGESIGRPHIASVLVEKGYFSCSKDVFRGCLSNGGICYEPRILPTPKKVIDIIKEAGGITVWAHPFHRGRNNKEFDSTLQYFISIGLNGIESYYSEFSLNQHTRALDYAKRNGLIITGGSDYHGDNQKDIFLGRGRGNLKIPNSVYDSLLKYYESIA